MLIRIRKMKKQLIAIIILLLAINVFGQEPSDLFSLKDMETKIEISSTILLQPKSTSAKISEFQTDILFFPREDKYLEIKEFETKPATTKVGDKLRYEWKSPQLATLSYLYQTIVNSKQQKPEIKTKINYPLARLPTEINKYTYPTPIINSQHPDVKRKALSLAQGKDDLFEIVTIIAAWIKHNIKYDLSSLTEQPAQAASWVLANKIGVCDELTSLFAAMLRSLGIPAKFISGVSYTNSPQFAQQWGAHGWAEVYFPEVGWVPYDVTFGEFGWIDAGHVKMMESTDPKEPSTQFEWTGRDVNVKVYNLNINAETIKYGEKAPTDINIIVNAAKDNVGAGSYNKIKVTIENLRDYYIATEFGLANVEELEESTTKEKKLVLLKPKEKKELDWIVRVKDNLNSEYIYRIPAVIYTIKNETAKTSFTVTKISPMYTKEALDKKKETEQKTEESIEKISEKEIKQKEETKLAIKGIATTEFTKYNEDFILSFRLEALSGTPKNIKVLTVIGKSKAHFEIDSLSSFQELIVNANTNSFLHKEENIDMTVTYQDEKGKTFTAHEIYPVKLEKITFWQKIKMFFARLFS